MRRLLCFASIMFILGFVRLACAQEPAKIVEQYVKAAGGGLLTVELMSAVATP